MATYNEQLQSIWHRFEAETGAKAATTHDAVEWAVGKGLITPKKIDPLAKLSEEMSDALRVEYRVDKFGRRFRVNHAVREQHSGVQYTLWAPIDLATREHMQKSFGQRRKQVVSDCLQLKNDVDVYNDIKSTQEPLTLILDFTADVAELQIMAEDSISERHDVRAKDPVVE